MRCITELAASDKVAKYGVFVPIDVESHDLINMNALQL